MFPLQEEDWLLYMAFLEKDEKMKPGTINQYLRHLTKFFACVRIPQPEWKAMKRMSVLKRRIDGLQIAKAVRKQPVDFKLVTRIIDNFDCRRADMIPFLAVLTIGVCGLFRLGELLVTDKNDVIQERLLRIGHVKFHPNRLAPEHMSIFIPYSKTDKYGQGHTVLIPANPNSLYCPVEYCKKLCEFGKPTDPLFRWPSDMLMTKSSFIKLLRAQLKKLNIEYKQYSGHSLRRGGALSAKAAGASDPLIKILRRWDSKAYKIYLKCTPGHIQDLNHLLAALRLIQL
jgi:hypothetical protein